MKFSKFYLTPLFILSGFALLCLAVHYAFKYSESGTKHKEILNENFFVSEITGANGGFEIYANGKKISEKEKSSLEWFAKQTVYLNLSGMDLSNLSSDFLGRFENLEQLTLDDSKFDESLFKSIHKCRRLRELYIRNCNVNRKMVNEVAKLKSLKRLNMEGGTLDARMLRPLAACRSLEYVEIYNSGISSEDLDTILLKILPEGCTLR